MYDKITAKGTFTSKITVGYSDLDYSLRLKPQSILELCQNVAVLHSDAAGYDLQRFRDNHSGWGLTEWHIVFNDRPKEGSKIDLTTWAKRHKRVQADRSFNGIDEDGNEIFKCLSRWFLLDTEKRKPKRFTDEFFDAYVASDIPMAFEDETFKHPALDLYEEVSTINHLVTRRDIDANKHTNNIAYISWALDDLPDDIYYGREIKDLRVEYKREALLGDTVTKKLMKRIDEDGLIEYSTVLSNADGDYLCRVTSKWV